jgi:hypothetical protein
MQNVIDVDPSGCHTLYVSYTENNFEAVCRTCMTHISFTVLNTNKYDIDKLKGCYLYCDYLSDQITQNRKCLFQKLGYCYYEFISWLNKIKRNLIDNNYSELDVKDVMIITLIFIRGTDIIKSIIEDNDCEQ